MNDPAARESRPMASMLCPSCHTALHMSERQGVEIDYCPQCRGVWLDRGELDKILERSARAETPPAQPQPQPNFRPDRGYAPQQNTGHRPHYEGDYQRKRRKSFLEELFD
ncbi:MAG: zf-TFIIB domain-containing protein [Sphingobium sp.]|uniref:TFIIB-type zinc ribbon-containing protein n=1 Tax=Sphingobium sp. TaxID=1912891 RepID=UPI0029BBA9D5|nr:zf-TFIIB domain-containing protein [Sphingobium sp.]MDX3910256.1 zf-TFIIB domain-containing protein [Sphingobium sp.]